MLCFFERVILSLGVLGRLAPLRGVFQRNTQKLKLMGLSLVIILTTNTYDMFPIFFHHMCMLNNKIYISSKNFEFDQSLETCLKAL